MKCRVISNHDKSHSKCIDCGREAGGSFRYENFLTTRQMYTYNTRPYIYPDDKCNINLCLNCYYDKYNTSIGFSLFKTGLEDNNLGNVDANDGII